MGMGEIFMLARFAHYNGCDQWCWFVGLHAGKSATVHNCPRWVALHVGPIWFDESEKNV